MRPGAVIVLLLGRPPSVHPSLFSSSEVDRGSVAGHMPTAELSPWAAMLWGLGGRGGGVGVEAWSSACVRESTLGVEDGRRGGLGCVVDAGRGIW